VEVVGYDADGKTILGVWHLVSNTTDASLVTSDSTLSAVWGMNTATISGQPVAWWTLTAVDGVGSGFAVSWSGHGDSGLIPGLVTIGGVSMSFIRLADPSSLAADNLARVLNMGEAALVGLFMVWLMIRSYWRSSVDL